MQKTLSCNLGDLKKIFFSDGNIFWVTNGYQNVRGEWSKIHDKDRETVSKIGRQYNSMGLYEYRCYWTAMCRHEMINSEIDF